MLLAALLPAAAYGARGNPEAGKAVFQSQCEVCHDVADQQQKAGPPLKGLFRKRRLANGKRPSSPAVREIIQAGGNGMPAFRDLLSPEQIEDLLAWLKTL